MRSTPVLALLLCATLALINGGCGGGSQGSVTGKVTYNGQPVTGGQLSFSPAEEGKSGFAQIQEDGTFVVGTNSESDGAVLGGHTVAYQAPDTVYPEGWQPGDKEPPGSPYRGLKVKEPQIEITSGANELTIELVK